MRASDKSSRPPVQPAGIRTARKRSTGRSGAEPGNAAKVVAQQAWDGRHARRHRQRNFGAERHRAAGGESTRPAGPACGEPDRHRFHRARRGRCRNDGRSRPQRAKARALAQALCRRAYVEIRSGRTAQARVDRRRGACGRPPRARPRPRGDGVAASRRSAIPDPQQRARRARQRAGRPHVQGAGPTRVSRGAHGGACPPRAALRAGSRKPIAPRTGRWRWRGAPATCTASATPPTCSRSTNLTSPEACSSCGRRSTRSPPRAMSSARPSSRTISDSGTACSACTSARGGCIYRRPMRTGAPDRWASRSRPRMWVLGHLEHELGLDHRRPGAPRARGRALGGGRRRPRARVPRRRRIAFGTLGRRTGAGRGHPRGGRRSQHRYRRGFARDQCLHRAGRVPPRRRRRRWARSKRRRTPRASIARIELADIQGCDLVEVWWWHLEALRANGKDAAAARALAIAYRLMVEPIAKLTDEGLRRNYLNKIAVNRRIVAARLAGRSPRAGAATRRLAHLAGDVDAAGAVRAAGRHRPAPERTALTPPSCTNS